MRLDDAKRELLKLVHKDVCPFKEPETGERSWFKHDGDVACFKYIHNGIAHGVLFLRSNLRFAYWDWPPCEEPVRTDVMPDWIKNGDEWGFRLWHLTIPPESVNEWYRKFGYYDI